MDLLEVNTEVDPPEVNMEVDPPEVNTEVDPLEVNTKVDPHPTRSEHRSGPPEMDAEEVVKEDQLRSTAGQAGGMP